MKAIPWRIGRRGGVIPVLLLIGVALTASSATIGAQTVEIGLATYVVGEVRLIRDGVVRPLRVGQAIEPYDVVEVGRDGATRLWVHGPVVDRGFVSPEELPVGEESPEDAAPGVAPVVTLDMVGASSIVIGDLHFGIDVRIAFGGVEIASEKGTARVHTWAGSVFVPEEGRAVVSAVAGGDATVRVLSVGVWVGDGDPVLWREDVVLSRDQRPRRLSHLVGEVAAPTEPAVPPTERFDLGLGLVADRWERLVDAALPPTDLYRRYEAHDPPYPIRHPDARILDPVFPEAWMVLADLFHPDLPVSSAVPTDDVSYPHLRRRLLELQYAEKLLILADRFAATANALDHGEPNPNGPASAPASPGM